MLVHGHQPQEPGGTVTDATSASTRPGPTGVDRAPSPEDVDTIAALRHEIGGLREALASRTLISSAVGLLMATGALTADEAFEHLRQASQHRNTKLRTVAAEIVERHERRVQEARERRTPGATARSPERRSSPREGMQGGLPGPESGRPGAASSGAVTTWLVNVLLRMQPGGRHMLDLLGLRVAHLDPHLELLDDDEVVLHLLVRAPSDRGAEGYVRTLLEETPGLWSDVRISVEPP